jgi:hypothetical protein
LFVPTLALPLSFQRSDGAPQESIRAPVMDLVLEPGDVLYVPRGWWHNVIPFEEGSCHVSVGAYAATVHDYLLWVCSQMLSREPHARRAFPPSPEDAPLLGDILLRLRQHVMDPGTQRRFETELLMRERQHGEVNLALHLTNARLPGRARLRLTTSRAAPLENRTVVLNGAVHELDPIAWAIVTALRDSISLTFDALTQRVAAVSRDDLGAVVLDLARHELLTIELPTA